jgi:hypothetical protein
MEGLTHTIMEDGDRPADPGSRITIPRIPDLTSRYEHVPHMRPASGVNRAVAWDGSIRIEESEALERIGAGLLEQIRRWDEDNVRPEDRACLIPLRVLNQAGLPVLPAVGTEYGGLMCQPVMTYYGVPCYALPPEAEEPPPRAQPPLPAESSKLVQCMCAKGDWSDESSAHMCVRLGQKEACVKMPKAVPLSVNDEDLESQLREAADKSIAAVMEARRRARGNGNG